MIQNIITKPNFTLQNYKQTNSELLYNQYNKEKSFKRNNERKLSNAKKSVSFNEKVEIVNVESWKKYNVDVSEETEYGKLRREILELKKNQLLVKSLIKDDCTCFIF